MFHSASLSVFSTRLIRSRIVLHPTFRSSRALPAHHISSVSCSSRPTRSVVETPTSRQSSLSRRFSSRPSSPDSHPNDAHKSGKKDHAHSSRHRHEKSHTAHPERGHNQHHGGYVGASHQLKHRATEKLGMKLAEATTAKLLPRLLARVQKRLGLQLIFRKLLRGVAIALPAIGGVFAAVVTFYDLRRAMKERDEQKNPRSALAFAVATGFDLVDVAAHVVTTLALAGMLHQFHHIEHMSEVTSLVAAVVATSAVIVGELLTTSAIAKESEAEQAAVGEDVERKYDSRLDAALCSPEGVLTSQASDAFIRIFNHYDTDHDGFLNRHELENYLRHTNSLTRDTKQVVLEDRSDERRQEAKEKVKDDVPEDKSDVKATAKSEEVDPEEVEFILNTYPSDRLGNSALDCHSWLRMNAAQALVNPAQTWRDLKLHGEKLGGR